MSPKSYSDTLAEALVATFTWIFSRRSTVRRQPTDEYYIADVIGCRTVDYGSGGFSEHPDAI